MSEEPRIAPEVEARLLALLRQLADDPPAGPPVGETVLATVRWQTAVREAAVVVGELADAAVEALGLLLGVREPDRTSR